MTREPGDSSTMTDHHDDKSVASARIDAGDKPSGLSRRALLRGASAVPAVLTLNTATAITNSSLWVTASSTGEPVDDNFVCLDTQGAAGPRYYIDSGSTATAISDTQLFVRADVLNGVDLTKPQKVAKAIKDAITAGGAVQGNSVCVDYQVAYIPVAADGPLYVGGVPVTQPVTFPRGALLSVSAYSSLDAGQHITTYPYNPV